MCVLLPPNVSILKRWPHAAIMDGLSLCFFGLGPSVWDVAEWRRATAKAMLRVGMAE